MAYDAIATLRDAGTPVDQLNDAQRDVISTLTPAEVDILVDVNRRMAAVESDVEGHIIAGIGIF